MINKNNRKTKNKKALRRIQADKGHARKQSAGAASKSLRKKRSVPTLRSRFSSFGKGKEKRSPLVPLEALIKKTTSQNKTEDPKSNHKRSRKASFSSFVNLSLTGKKHLKPVEEYDPFKNLSDLSLNDITVILDPAHDENTLPLPEMEDVRPRIRESHDEPFEAFMKETRHLTASEDEIPVIDEEDTVPFRPNTFFKGNEVEELSKEKEIESLL